MSEVAEAFHGTVAELLATNLTPEREERLLGAFGLTGATADRYGPESARLTQPARALQDSSEAPRRTTDGSP